MPVGTNLHFFVDGVKPLWEDEQCKTGGRITLNLPKTHTAKYWEDLAMAMVGEQFSLRNEVLGIVMSLKFHCDSISVWHRSSDEKSIEALKNDIKRLVVVEEASMKLMSSIFSE